MNNFVFIFLIVKHRVMSRAAAVRLQLKSYFSSKSELKLIHASEWPVLMLKQPSFGNL